MNLNCEALMIYKVNMNFQGYIRGTCTHEVEANSEEEAILNCPKYINESTIDIIRDDTEITDISL
ncbi:hypothetical protein KNV77_gp024 [Klebsiella phage vB_KpnP_P184]|uniref:Uncharacterized protein n=1 Tax=Klebsiella phage vB_KpnP_P184 TaxID=2806547 RepID=A0A898KAN5_9CAUD|nr:hypothetical protein KNV77_gp024 [Klebsiella phage vB_KpnP_P184]QSJ03677.1 hypothetical protein [Klebsiella phage vB_KpnP_P184]